METLPWEDMIVRKRVAKYVKYKNPELSISDSFYEALEFEIMAVIDYGINTAAFLEKKRLQGRFITKFMGRGEDEDEQIKQDNERDIFD